MKPVINMPTQVGITKGVDGKDILSFVSPEGSNRGTLDLIDINRSTKALWVHIYDVPNPLIDRTINLNLTDLMEMDGFKIEPGIYTIVITPLNGGVQFETAKVPYEVSKKSPDPLMPPLASLSAPRVEPEGVCLRVEVASVESVTVEIHGKNEKGENVFVLAEYPVLNSNDCLNYSEYHLGRLQYDKGLLKAGKYTFMLRAVSGDGTQYSEYVPVDVVLTQNMIDYNILGKTRPQEPDVTGDSDDDGGDMDPYIRRMDSIFGRTSTIMEGVRTVGADINAVGGIVVGVSKNVQDLQKQVEDVLKAVKATTGSSSLSADSQKAMSDHIKALEALAGKLAALITTTASQRDAQDIAKKVEALQVELGEIEKCIKKELGELITTGFEGLTGVVQQNTKGINDKIDANHALVMAALAKISAGGNTPAPVEQSRKGRDRPSASVAIVGIVGLILVALVGLLCLLMSKSSGAPVINNYGVGPSVPKASGMASASDTPPGVVTPRRKLTAIPSTDESEAKEPAPAKKPETPKAEEPKVRKATNAASVDVIDTRVAVAPAPVQYIPANPSSYPGQVLWTRPAQEIVEMPVSQTINVVGGYGGDPMVYRESVGFSVGFGFGVGPGYSHGYHDRGGYRDYGHRDYSDRRVAVAHNRSNPQRIDYQHASPRRNTNSGHSQVYMGPGSGQMFNNGYFYQTPVLPRGYSRGGR